MSLFEDWPYTFYGIWKLKEPDFGRIPLFSEVVDESWKPADLDQLVAYLMHAPFSLPVRNPDAWCFICNQRFNETGGQRSDGTWTWASDLDHFVAKHNVRLPDRMVDHIRSRKYSLGKVE